MTLQEITTELDKYYKVLQSNYNEGDGNALTEKLKHISIILAYSSELMAWAQFHVDNAKGEWAEKLHDEGYSATVLSKILDSKIAQESRVLKLCDRLNSSCRHQIDSLRTQISYIKDTRFGG